jgi:hypothetical protein
MGSPLTWVVGVASVVGVVGAVVAGGWVVGAAVVVVVVVAVVHAATRSSADRTGRALALVLNLPPPVDDDRVSASSQPG